MRHDLLVRNSEGFGQVAEMSGNFDCGACGFLSAGKDEPLLVIVMHVNPESISASRSDGQGRSREC